jgi:hypothetical protein
MATLTAIVLTLSSISPVTGGWGDIFFPTNPPVTTPVISAPPTTPVSGSIF